MGFRWQADGGPTLNADLVAVWFLGGGDQYCKETLYFCDFSGEVWTPCPPPLWIRTWLKINIVTMTVWYQDKNGSGNWNLQHIFMPPKELWEAYSNRTVRPSICPSVPLSCPVHISYILWGRNSKFGVWIHLGMAECRVPFSGHCELDLDLWPSF